MFLVGIGLVDLTVPKLGVPKLEKFKRTVHLITNLAFAKRNRTRTAKKWSGLAKRRLLKQFRLSPYPANGLHYDHDFN